MREEITPTSLPAITISDADRLLNDPEYRQRCATRLVEIVLDIDEQVVIIDCQVYLYSSYLLVASTYVNSYFLGQLKYLVSWS
ncbi:MAG: hypothetical protein ACFKPT_05845 [Gloeotrichia echinulata GP01]